jgi:hypothetical protein
MTVSFARIACIACAHSTLTTHIFDTLACDLCAVSQPQPRASLDTDERRTHARGSPLVEDLFAIPEHVTSARRKPVKRLFEKTTQRDLSRRDEDRDANVLHVQHVLFGQINVRDE